MVNQFAVKGKGAYIAPEALVTDFEMEVSVLQSSTEDLFNGEPLN